MTDAAATARLTSFYGRLSPSLDFIRWVLEQASIDLDHVQPRDLYERDLDCHNLGMHVMVERIADVAAEYGAPGPDDTVLDLGCGLGGPGRIVADRFGCRIEGVDLLPLRVELAKALATMTKMSDRTTYRVADATQLEFDTSSFDQVWMLDVSMHIRDKAALFAEIARVLRPGGLLVMHEQTGPLPKEMRPVTRQAAGSADANVAGSKAASTASQACLFDERLIIGGAQARVAPVTQVTSVSMRPSS